jgi:hypothetical protein
LKDESTPGAAGLGSDERFAQPRELITRFARNLFGLIDELAVQDDPVHIAPAIGHLNEEGRVFGFLTDLDLEPVR